MSPREANSEQAEPARRSVPRQSLGTRTTSNWEVLNVLHERTEHLKRLGERLDVDSQQLRDQFRELNITVAKLQQQLTDYIAHNEKWDTRRWALLAAVVGGLVVNIVMLFMNRK
jgi:TolA-binding protein